MYIIEIAVAPPDLCFDFINMMMGSKPQLETRQLVTVP